METIHESTCYILQAHTEVIIEVFNGTESCRSFRLPGNDILQATGISRVMETNGLRVDHDGGEGTHYVIDEKDVKKFRFTQCTPVYDV